MRMTSLGLFLKLKVELDKIHANQIDRNAQDNCLDSSDEVEDNEIEYITLGHLCSGIIDELADEDANHIGGEWHTVSKKKNSSRK